MPKKQLLVYANYYYPEVASLAQLCTDLCEGMTDAFDITVICAVPCYTGAVEEKYLTCKYYFEEYNGVRVIRVKVSPYDKQNKLSRVKNILAYFFHSVSATFKAPKADYILTESQPPVLGGLLGVAGKWINALRGKRSRMVYVIQDFNPEQTMAVNYTGNRLVLGAMMAFDKFSCRRSDLVITVGRDLVDTLKKRFHGKKVPNHALINNWIDEKEVYPLPMDHEGVQKFRRRYGLQDKYVVMYSGNIGLFYDLENLMKVMETIQPGTCTPDGREVAFAFVGAGSLLEPLKAYAAEKHMDNVYFIPYQDKEDLIYSLNAADVHWCVNAKGIKGVSCPSKFYGIAAAAKPVLAVLEEGSEVRMLIEETGCGLCCEPRDYRKVEENLNWFIAHAGTGEAEAMGRSGYDYLVRNLTKDVSIRKYKDAIRGL